MTRKVDTRIRLTLVLLALVALGYSFMVGALEDIDRAPRFTAMAILGIITAWAGSTGIDVIQGYTKRRPLRLRWGKPATELGAATRAPDRRLPPDWVARTGLRASALVAGVAGSLAAALILGTIGYALAGSASPYGSGLLVYLLLAVAVGSTLRFGIKSLFRKQALDITQDTATLGRGVGYWPELVIARGDVTGLEVSAERQLLAFVTAERRFEVSTTMLDNPHLMSEIAGVWPEKTWHDLSPHAVPTTLIGDS